MKVTGGLIRLNALFKGEIVSDGAVVVHDQGEVEGDIQSQVVSITGKVKGSVHAKERLEIKEHGIVMGDIYTPCLLVDPGGFFDGQCHMPTPGRRERPGKSGRICWNIIEAVVRPAPVRSMSNHPRGTYPYSSLHSHRSFDSLPRALLCLRRPCLYFFGLRSRSSTGRRWRLFSSCFR